MLRYWFRSLKAITFLPIYNCVQICVGLQVEVSTRYLQICAMGLNVTKSKAIWIVLQHRLIHFFWETFGISKNRSFYISSFCTFVLSCHCYYIWNLLKAGNVLQWAEVDLSRLVAGLGHNLQTHLMTTSCTASPAGANQHSSPQSSLCPNNHFNNPNYNQTIHNHIQSLILCALLMSPKHIDWNPCLFALVLT